MRLVELDEGVFQHEGFKLARHDDDIERRDVLDHGGDLWQVLAAKIARDAVFERLGLADIDDLARLVEHEIHARLLRQHVGALAQLVQCQLFHLIPPPPWTGADVRRPSRA